MTQLATPTSPAAIGLNFAGFQWGVRLVGNDDSTVDEPSSTAAEARNIAWAHTHRGLRAEVIRRTVHVGGWRTHLIPPGVEWGRRCTWHDGHQEIRQYASRDSAELQTRTYNGNAVLVEVVTRDAVYSDWRVESSPQVNPGRPLQRAGGRLRRRLLDVAMCVVALAVLYMAVTYLDHVCQP